MKKFSVTRAILAGSLLLAIQATGLLQATAMEQFSNHVDVSGKIVLPPDFRANMAHLGSWFVPGGDARGFHDVYTEKKSLEFYRKVGKFPDGATIVKELRPHASGDYTTGEGVSHATSAVKQIFVMIKDANNRFPDNKSWGEGWGWALFKSASGNTNLSKDFREDCLSCHVPAKGTDWIYVQGYPSLTKGK